MENPPDRWRNALPEHLSDDDVGKAIQTLAGTETSVAKIAHAMGFDVKDLGRELRDYRRRFALLVFAGLAPDIYKHTRRYYELLEKTLDEMGSRDLAELDAKDLLRFHDSLVKWIMPVNVAVALAPRDSGIDRDGDSQQPSVNFQKILMLVNAVHDAKKEGPPSPSPSSESQP